MARIHLVRLDPTKTADINLTYDILLYRFLNVDKQQIRYRSRKNAPTLQEHIKHLISNDYKGYYKLMLEKKPVGTIHINNEDMVGIFFLPSLLKKAIRECRQNNIDVEVDYISSQAFIELYKLHPDITVYYCSVNPKNKLSINALVRHGFELNELIYTMKTSNGKPDQGPWKHE